MPYLHIVINSMGEITKFLCFLVSICLVSKGSTQISIHWCPPKVIVVNQVPTGRQVGIKPEWNVTINNTCACTILSFKLSCPNFQSLEAVDPTIISKSDDGNCLINNGQPLYAQTSINFTYAGDKVEFALFDYGEACS